MTNQDNIDWAREQLGKHLDSAEEAATAPEDNLIQRYAVLAELDRRIAFWQRQANPKSAWFQGDIAKLAMLRSVREFVVELEGEWRGND